MKETYNNHTIEVVPSGTGAHRANIYSSDGILLKSIFTLHGAYSAMAGAKNRLWIPPTKKSIMDQIREKFA